MEPRSNLGKWVWNTTGFSFNTAVQEPCPGVFGIFVRFGKGTHGDAISRNHGEYTVSRFRFRRHLHRISSLECKCRVGLREVFPVRAALCRIFQGKALSKTRHPGR